MNIDVRMAAVLMAISRAMALTPVVTIQTVAYRRAQLLASLLVVLLVYGFVPV